MNGNDIGCAIPFLQTGNVRFQVMAIFTVAKEGSSQDGMQQSLMYRQLLTDYSQSFKAISTVNELNDLLSSTSIGTIAAVENAAGFCEEKESLKKGFAKLEKLIENAGRVLYITLTHHTENRFGGGNYSTKGLTNDGRALLDYLQGRKIAVDLSHTSDVMAYDILNYTAQHNLDVPVMASHSNFRPIFNHVRNLPPEIAQEIVARRGLIGVNFVRAFVNNQHPEALIEHILYGIQNGAADSMCFGADFFYAGGLPDTTRIPYYFEAHENAGCYPTILDQLAPHLSNDQLVALSHKNVFNFIQRLWM